eukprot:1136313-Pelagomonas_calceolata.AAC.8
MIPSVGIQYTEEERNILSHVHDQQNARVRHSPLRVDYESTEWEMMSRHAVSLVAGSPLCSTRAASGGRVGICEEAPLSLEASRKAARGAVHLAFALPGDSSISIQVTQAMT